MGTEVRVVDRAGVGEVRCELEGGKALIELGKNVNARRVETGYGRLFFRYGKRLSASLKQLIVDDKNPGRRRPPQHSPPFKGLGGLGQIL
jgi:hypothetical protein